MYVDVGTVREVTSEFFFFFHLSFRGFFLVRYTTYRFICTEKMMWCSTYIMNTVGMYKNIMDRYFSEYYSKNKKKVEKKIMKAIYYDYNDIYSK